MSVQQCLKHVWISGEGNINDPITIKDIIACFTKTQTFSVVSLFLDLLRGDLEKMTSYFSFVKRFPKLYSSCS